MTIGDSSQQNPAYRPTDFYLSKTNIGYLDSATWQAGRFGVMKFS